MGYTAIFGGTFNPFHIGHYEMLKALENNENIDEILLLPDKIPPHKTSDYLASDEHRIEIGVLVRPFFNIFQGGKQDADTVTLNTALALCDDLTASVGKGEGCIDFCRCGKLNRQLATPSGEHRLYENVGNSCSSENNAV